MTGIKKKVSDKLVLKKKCAPFILPEIEIAVDDCLGLTVKGFSYFLPEDHPLYLSHRRPVTNVTISRLVKELDE